MVLFLSPVFCAAISFQLQKWEKVNMLSDWTCCIMSFGLYCGGGLADALYRPSLSSTMFSKQAQEADDSAGVAIL